MENDIRKELVVYEAEKSVRELKKRHKTVLQHLMNGEGYYIWGTGRLGKFCSEQMQKTHNTLRGFIDNDKSRWDTEKKIYSPACLSEDDIIIAASLFYPQILEQLHKTGNCLAVYYEELAYIMEELDTYYMGFQNIFTELEENKKAYINIFDVLCDDISKEIYKNLLKFRMTLDHRYTSAALQLSLQYGSQDFDELVVRRFNEHTSFYDIGGFDGQTTLDFIQRASAYKKIYFFEPDRYMIEQTKERLSQYSNIEFYLAVVGNRTGKIGFSSSGDGSSFASEEGGETVDMVCLDDFIDSSESYVKFDVEGFELSALEGCEQAIRKYKPMLSVSLYHRAGDIHALINRVLNWNADYLVYLRHYTGTYADTRAYFIQPK